MKNKFGNCCETTNNRLITLQEKRSKVIINNNDTKDINIIRIDGCVVTNDTACDYMVVNNNTEHYIELKGCDIIRAIEQIATTIDKISEKSAKIPKHSYIVTSRCPLASTEIQKQRIIFSKKLNSTLTIKNRLIEINFN